MIEVRFHPKVRGISAAFVRRAIGVALETERAGKHDVSAYVTTDVEIRTINKKHLKHDYATDVLSFRAAEDTFLGDVVVSADFARCYAVEHKIPFREELSRYLVHGTLHLLGYDDRKPSDYKKMHKRQEQILNKIHA